MNEIIRCEGLGSVSLMELVDRLSKPNQSFEEEKESDDTALNTTIGIKAPNNNKIPKTKVTHRCPVDSCGRVFCKKTALDNHVSRHNRVYKCDECEKCFSEQAKVIIK